VLPRCARLSGEDIAEARLEEQLPRETLLASAPLEAEPTPSAERDARIDVSPATLENYRTHRIRLVELLGDRDPHTIRWQDVQAVSRRSRRTCPRLVAPVPVHVAAVPIPRVGVAC
jgi:hypothetical protein